MVSSDRLLWLAGQVHSGRQASVSFSYNAELDREKVKFVLQPRVSKSRVVFRPCLMGALSAVQAACGHSIVTDKGHSSSSGQSVIEFWIAQLRLADASNNSGVGDTGSNVQGDPPIPSPPTPPPAGTGVGTEWEVLPPPAYSDVAMANSSLDWHLGAADACTTLDGEVTESAMVPPPRKRVRFCPHDEVTFMNASSLAPQSLEEFLADVPSTHSPSLAACDQANVSPATRIEVQMEAYTYVLENSKGLQKLVNDSQPFLPTDEHQLLLDRCSYLMELCDKFLLQPGEFKDKFDALAEIYSGIRYDFEVCFERVRTAAQP